MTLWPRTLFGRVFALQLLLLVLVLAALMLLLTRYQSQANAAQLAELWTPALADAQQRDDLPAGPWSIAVRRNIAMQSGPPPTDAWNPEGTPRFAALAEALRANGLPVRGLRVSGRTRDAVLWVELADATGDRWFGIETSLEGEDLPWRFLASALVALALALCIAGAIAWMVASPARRLAQAVTRFGEGDPDPQLPSGGPAEIRALVGSVRDTFEARRALDAQREFMLAGLSHDLRAPLSRLRLAAELAGAEDWQAARERIIANADTLDRLIGDFATLIRDESGPLDAREDLGALVEVVACACGWPGDCAVIDTGLVVATRGTLLRRLVDNLIDNALRYGRAPFELRVERIDGGVGLLTVSNGIDGPAPDLARLRRPFERGEPHRGTPGSGLGLSIVERLGARLGGDVALALRDDGQRWEVCVRVPLMHAAGPRTRNAP